MKRMKHLITSVALLLVGAVSVQAQMTLSVDEAVQIALSENPTIKVAELEVERYDYVRKTTFGSLLPQISVSGDFTRTLKNQSMAEGFTLGSEQYNTISASADATLALYAPAVYRTMKMNKIEASVAVESARSSKIEMVAAVKQAFYNIVLAQKSLTVMESSYETAKQTVYETQIKFDNGIASEYDLLTAQVQQSNIEPTIIQLKSSIEIAKDLLKMYLSIPDNITIEVTGELETMKSEAIGNFTTISTDISENSTLKSLDLQSEILAQSKKVSNAARLPTLAAWGSYTYTGNNMGSFDLTGSGTASTDKSYFWQGPAYVGLSLSVPIFTGLSNTYRAKQITNQIEQLKLQRSYTEESVKLSVRTAISDLITAREQMLAQQTVVEQATKAYAISDVRYKAGAGTILELNSASLAQTQAELNYSQAIYDLLVAFAEYNKIIGKEN
ncbi:MAG: TolC family protein [Rikenellaceae bacterium]